MHMPSCALSTRRSRPQSLSTNATNHFLIVKIVVPPDGRSPTGSCPSHGKFALQIQNHITPNHSPKKEFLRETLGRHRKNRISTLTLGLAVPGSFRVVCFARVAEEKCGLLHLNQQSSQADQTSVRASCSRYCQPAQISLNTVAMHICMYVRLQGESLGNLHADAYGRERILALNDLQYVCFQMYVFHILSLLPSLNSTFAPCCKP